MSKIRRIGSRPVKKTPILSKSSNTGQQTVRSGPKIIGGSGMYDDAITKGNEYETETQQAYRDKLKPTHRSQFNSDVDFNRYADFFYNYRKQTGDGMYFEAPTQSMGGFDAVIKGGSSAVSRGIARSLPSIFRGIAGFEGPTLITPTGSSYMTSIQRIPGLQSMTPAQIQQYTFGPVHSSSDNIPPGTGTLADYMRSRGPITSELQPFLDLYNQEISNNTQQQSQEFYNRLAEEAAKTPLPEEEPEPTPTPSRPSQPAQDRADQGFAQAVDVHRRNQLWNDMWRKNPNKPKGGQSKNGTWRNEMASILEGENIPPRDTPEYNDFITRMKDKFYKTPKGSTIMPIINALPDAPVAPVAPVTPVVPAPAPVQPNAPIAPVQPNAPIAPVQPNAPVQPGQPNAPVQPGQPNAPVQPPLHLPGRGTARAIQLPPNAQPIGVRQILGPDGRPILGPDGQPSRRPWWLPFFPFGPGTPDAPTPNAPDKKPNKPNKPDKKPDEKEPDDKKPDDEKPDDPNKPVDADDHKNVAGSGYGYARPEFTTDTGAESLVLTQQESILALTQWDKFDDVTDAIYTLDNPLYMQHVKKDQLRYSGIARDPYFYVGIEYENLYAPDPFRAYPTQGSMQSSNNLSTAMGQVRYNPYLTVGPRQRSLANRVDPSYETDLIDRMNINPDLQELILDKEDEYDDTDSINNLIIAFGKSIPSILENRWTTPTSSFEDFKIETKKID